MGKPMLVIEKFGPGKNEPVQVGKACCHQAHDSASATTVTYNLTLCCISPTT